MGLVQTTIFGDADPVKVSYEIDMLPRAVNDNAHSLYILILEKRPIDFFTVAKRYGVTKFQSRIGEIIAVYPDLVEKKSARVPKRLGRVVDVTTYFIRDKQRAMKLYMEVINKKGSHGRLINHTIDEDDSKL